jgi:hypothetical protein
MACAWVSEGSSHISAGSFITYLTLPDAYWEDSPDSLAAAGATGAMPQDQAINPEQIAHRSLPLLGSCPAPPKGKRFISPWLAALPSRNPQLPAGQIK